MMEKQCLECLTPIKGRSDKRFCDDSCRNAYNNKINSDQNAFMRQVVTTLKKNRKILATLLGGEKLIKIPKDKLLSEGFQLTYHTHQLQTSKGQTYIFCFEYGYLPLDNDLFLIVKSKETT